MNSKKQIVLIDVDGVVADFIQLYLNCVRTALGIEIAQDWQPMVWNLEKALGLTEAQEVKVNKLLNSSGMASMISVIPGSIDGVKNLAKLAEVYFVTSPFYTSPTWVYERAEWLTKHFGELGKKVVFTSHKHLVRGDVLIDDKPQNCVEWQKAWPSGSALTWAAPYNIMNFELSHVFDWSLVESVIRAREVGDKFDFLGNHKRMSALKNKQTDMA